MNKLVIRSLVSLIFFTLHIYTQNKNQEIENSNINASVFKNAEKLTFKTESYEIADSKIVLFRYSMDFLRQDRLVNNENQFDIVKSFRSNIRFGGFWDKYVIVNYTPEMSIEPAKHITFSARHNLSYFIPLTGLRDHFKLMAVQSAAVLVIDSSVKLLLPEKGMFRAVLNFALKNLILHYMLRSVTANGNDKVMEFGYYYYSLSIRF